MPAPSEFRRDGEREVYRGHVISLVIARVEGPDGEVFERDVVHHPGAVSVVAVTDEDTVPFVRQYRAAIDGWLLEIPAGKRDVDGEPPETTAHRELVEEVGRRAGRLVKLAEFYNSPGFSDEHSHVYLGLDLEPASPNRQGIEEQHLVVEELPLDEIPERIACGDITDAKTIIGLTLALRHLGR